MTTPLPGTVISSLPPVVGLTGQEYVPLVQAGTTKRSTAGAIASLANLTGSGTASFITATASPSLPNARMLTGQSVGTFTIISTLDGGAGSTFAIGINAFVGDTGSGGVKGAVPAPSAGDAAAGKVLGAGGSFVVSGLTGIRNAQSGDYTVLASDNGKTIAMTGAFKTLTVDPASGYPTPFKFEVLAENTGRGQKISPDGITSFVQWPIQVITIEKQNNAWVVDPPSQRWRIPSAQTFYVDVLSGSATLTDGLASGSAAFNSIQTAVNNLKNLDFNGFVPVIQLAQAGGTSGFPSYTTGATIATHPLGQHIFTIQGDPAAPQNYAFDIAAGPGFTVTDWGAINLIGVQLGSSTGQILLQITQFADIDLAHCRFTSNGAQQDILLGGDGLAKLNFVASNTLSGNCGYFVRALSNSVVTFGSGGFVYDTLNVNVGVFCQLELGAVGVIDGTCVFSGAGLATAGGQAFNVNSGSTLYQSGTSFPPGFGAGVNNGGWVDGVFTAVNPVFNNVRINGTTSGSLLLSVPAIAGNNTWKFPAGSTDFSATGGSGNVLQQSSVGAAITVGPIAASGLSNGTTGTGQVVLQNSAIMVTPNIGAAIGASFVGTSGVVIYNGTAPPVGGTTGAGFKVSSTSNLGFFFGSGVPTLSAGTGSYYLRTDGNSTNTRAYINTNGATTWTPIVTVA